MPTLSIFAIESWYRPCQSSDHVGSQRQTLIPDRQTGARWTPEWRVTNEDPHLILAESILGAEVLRCWFTFYKHWFGPVLNALLALPFPVMEHDGLHFVTLAQDFFSAWLCSKTPDSQFRHAFHWFWKSYFIRTQRGIFTLELLIIEIVISLNH